MHSPPSVLPPIYEDEALGHYVLRVQSLSGGDSYRTVTRTLFGQPLSHLDWALPCNIAKLAETCNLLTGTPNTEYWLLNHTLFPYYAAVATPPVCAAIRSRMLNRQIGPTRQWQALSVGEVMRRYAKYCSVCAAGDLEHVGIPYVRTFHLLPYLSYCHLHGEALMTLDGPHISSGKAVESGTALSLCRENLSPEQRFSLESVRLLREGPNSRDAYFETLRAAGWWGETKFAYRSRLRELVLDHWRGAYIDSNLKTLAQTDNGVSQLLRCFGSRRKLVHPVAAILIRSACESRPLAVGSSPPLASRSREDYRERLSRALASFDMGASLRHAAQSAQVSVTSLATAAAASGRIVKRRPKRLTLELVERIHRRIARGDLPTEIALNEGVSISTVYRLRTIFLKSLSTILANRLAKQVQFRRRLWLAKCDLHPNATINQVRAMFPATYAWLYRKDRDWLLAQNSKRKKLPRLNKPSNRGPRLDLLPALTSAVARILRDKDKPMRLTKAYVYKRAGFTYARYRTITEFPTDTSTSFLKRRIRWASEQLSKSGSELIAWQVFRKAGMRRQAWESAGLNATNLYYHMASDVTHPHSPVDSE